MEKKTKAAALLYGAVTSVTVLVMLNTTFALFKEKYFPSFMLAQKYALLPVIAAMMLLFLAYFEPERLRQQRTITLMRVTMTAALALFTVYLFSLDYLQEELSTVIVYGAQWLVTLLVTLHFFSYKNGEAV